MGLGFLWISIACFAYNINSFFHLWCMLGGSVSVRKTSNLFRFIEGQKHLAPVGMPKWVWPIMSQYRMIFAQTSTQPPNMEGVVCKLTISHILKDDSIIIPFCFEPRSNNNKMILLFFILSMESWRIVVVLLLYLPRGYWGRYTIGCLLQPIAWQHLSISRYTGHQLWLVKDWVTRWAQPTNPYS